MIYKLFPACKAYIWGGTKLQSYGKTTDQVNIAETWELSFHKDGPSSVRGGLLKDVVRKEGLGTNLSRFEDFPTLIKFIDAKENLSVQVHPSDDYARKNEGYYGKSEMWYIVEAEEGAGIYLGFNRDVTKEEYAAAIEDGTITDLLNFVSVKSGDCFFIPAGTVHSICKGCVILEIQQNSNLTYRVYDYKRKDIFGNTRPLHIDKALAVSNLKKFKVENRRGELLGLSKYFTVRRFDVKEKTFKTNGSTFVCVTCVKGSGLIDDFALKAGDSFFVTADHGEFTVAGDVTVVTTEIRRYYIGIDLGGTFIKGGVVDDNGVIIEKGSVPTEREGGVDHVCRRIADFCFDLALKAGMTIGDIDGLGAGVPGLIDGKNGFIKYSNNLEWKDFYFADRLNELTGLKVFIANDADAAALGEYTFGAGKGTENCVLVTLGTGVGGGVIIGGKLYTGNESSGVEIGHTVIKAGGKSCNCGRKGCFEAYSSATALIESTKRAMQADRSCKMWQVGSLKAVDGATAFRYYKEDAAAKKVVEGYIEMLAVGIVNISNAYRPERIIIGGGISRQGDDLIKPLQKAVDELSFGGVRAPKCKVVAAKTLNDAGVLGAAALVI